MLFDILTPPRVLFGPGSTYRLGEEVTSFGRRALVITGRRSLAESGQMDRITTPLKQAGVETVWHQVDPEPTVEAVDQARGLLRSEGCQVVVGVGGGSVLDVAKAAAGLAGEEEPTAAFFDPLRAPRPGLPWVAVPTTAGSGAEATYNAVLINPAQSRKASVRDERWLAAVAVVDPILTMSQPPALTAQTGMDALTHAIEAHTSRWHTAYTSGLSREAFRLIVQNFFTAYDSGRQRDAREKMMLGSLMAGMALANARAGLVHALAHPIGVRYGLPHGLVCGILLPYAVHFNMVLLEDTYAALAKEAGITGPGTDTGAAAAKLLIYLERLRERLGLPERLSAVGLKEDDIPGIIEDVMPSQSLAANPRRVTRQDLNVLLYENL